MDHLSYKKYVNMCAIISFEDIWNVKILKQILVFFRMFMRQWNIISIAVLWEKMNGGKGVYWWMHKMCWDISVYTWCPKVILVFISGKSDADCYELCMHAVPCSSSWKWFLPSGFTAWTFGAIGAVQVRHMQLSKLTGENLAFSFHYCLHQHKGYRLNQMICYVCDIPLNLQ